MSWQVEPWFSSDLAFHHCDQNKCDNLEVEKYLGLTVSELQSMVGRFPLPQTRGEAEPYGERVLEESCLTHDS